ncbi:AAA family ATPase [Klebsiella pneumoniae]|nr:AAA family ATPase [Klebsiella pneumoniae]
MKFLKLEIENFMVIAEASVELNDRGLVLIQGRNRDDSSANSNGAGKSTLTNALCWALYGETATGLKGDDVLSTGVEKNCRVRVLIEDDDGRQYAVIRHRAHAEGKNRLMVVSDEGDMTKGTDKLTQTLVERLVGCSKEVFLASIYASQEAMPDLPGMTDKMLKAIVEEAAGVDRLTRAYAIARERANAAVAKLDAVRGKITVAERTLDNATEALDSTGSSLTDWDKKKWARVDEFRRQIAELEMEIAEATMELGDDDVLVSLDAQAAEIRKRMSSVGEHNKAVRSVENAMSDARSRLKMLTRDQEAETQSSLSQARLAKEVDGQVGTPCVTCGKPYCAEDLATVRSGYLRNAKTHLLNARQHQEKAAALTAALEKAEVKLKQLNDSAPDVSRELAELEVIERRRTGIISLRTHIAGIETRQKEAEAQMAKSMAEVNPFVALKEKAERDVAESKAVLRTLRKEEKELQGDVAILERARQVFSPAGVRNHILTSVTPLLNSRTAEYLNTLSDGTIEAVWSTMEATKKTGEYRDKFNIAVQKTGKAKNFAALSGGEKRKVRIATALALQDLVASRATKNIQLFIGDEIDDALDVAGLERLMAILEIKARERGTVMIVSHKEMKSWFRETITIEANEGRAYVI